MNRCLSSAAVEAVCDVIEAHADHGGVVDTRRVWRELRDLPLDTAVVQEIINPLDGTGYLWQWGEWIILPRPVQCPKCNRWIEVPLTRHMHEGHPRPTCEVAWVEWAD